jgi:hypothetical protein
LCNESGHLCPGYSKACPFTCLRKAKFFAQRVESPGFVHGEHPARNVSFCDIGLGLGTCNDRRAGDQELYGRRGEVA